MFSAQVYLDIFTRQLSTDCNSQGKLLPTVFWKTRLTNRCIVINVQHSIRREIQLCIFLSRAGKTLQLHQIKTPPICFHCLLPTAYTQFQLKHLHLFSEKPVCNQFLPLYTSQTTVLTKVQNEKTGHPSSTHLHTSVLLRNLMSVHPAYKKLGFLQRHYEPSRILNKDKIIKPINTLHMLHASTPQSTSVRLNSQHTKPMGTDRYCG